MKISTLVALTLFLGLSLTIIGCNTIRGVGEDISGSANFVEKKMTGDDGTNSNNPPQWPKQ
jgi:predicted small secreted protein